MGVFTRSDSPYYWLWLEGASRPRVNTKIKIGDTAIQKKENRRAALDIYHALMTNRARGRFGLPLNRPERSFLQQREWYAEHVSPLKRGATREVSMLKQLGAFFDRYQLADLDHTVAREWRAARSKQVTAATIRREEALLRHLMTTAVPEFIAANPLKGLKPVRVADTDTRVLSREEETRLLAALLTNEDKALVILALDSLLRLRDAADFTRKQDHRTFLFSDTKAGSVRVPISSRLRVAMDALPAPGAHYFPSYAEKHNNLVGRMFTEACARADVQTGRKTGGVSFHCLRHTGATRMLEAGVDAKTVMKLGGWKSLRVMERYLHPADEAARRAVEAVG